MTVFDTGEPQGSPPTSSPGESEGGGAGAGLDLDRLARLGTPPGGLDDAHYSIGAVEPWELRTLVARVRVLEAVAATLTSAPLTWHPRSEAESVSFEATLEAYKLALAAAGGGAHE